MTAEEFIGDSLFQKYKDIWPIVRLILFLCSEKMESALFLYDLGAPGSTTTIHRIVMPARYLLYQMRKQFARRPKEMGIFLSNTILEIDRYRGMLDELYTNYDVVASGAVSDFIHRPVPELGLLNWKIFLSRRLFFGKSLAGEVLKNSVKNLQSLFVKLIKENRVCSTEFEKVDEALRILQDTAHERIDEISLLLKEAGVKCYITVNSNYLGDMIAIMACRKAGIWTKELSHHTWCLMELDYWKSIDDWLYSDHGKKLSFVNESCQWSIAEKQYCEKYNSFHAIYNDLRISVTGCPEVTQAEFSKNIKKYPKTDAIVVFVPSIPYIGGNGTIPQGDPEMLQKITSNNFNMYRKVALLAEKYHMKVYVRYHPSEEKCHFKQEKELLAALGFELLSTSREDFIRAICTSRIAIGCMTSAFIPALIYGCKCYNLAYGGENRKFDYCGLDIHNISLNQILDITLDFTGNHMPVNYIDIDRLCSCPDESTR